MVTPRPTQFKPTTLFKLRIRKSRFGGQWAFFLGLGALTTLDFTNVKVLPVYSHKKNRIDGTQYPKMKQTSNPDNVFESLQTPDRNADVVPGGPHVHVFYT